MYENSFNSRVIYSRKLYSKLLIQMIIIGKDWQFCICCRIMYLPRVLVALNWQFPGEVSLAFLDRISGGSGNSYNSFAFPLIKSIIPCKLGPLCCIHTIISPCLQHFGSSIWLVGGLAGVLQSGKYAKKFEYIVRHDFLFIRLFSNSEEKIDLLRVNSVLECKCSNSVWNVHCIFNCFAILANGGFFGFIPVCVFPDLRYLD